MFRSHQYRAKATECSELVKSSTSAEESYRFQDLENRFVSLADNPLADNERVLADAYNDAVHIAEQNRSRGRALDAEGQYVLRCLGVAVITERNDVAATEIFDTAGSVQVVGDSGAPRADLPISAHTQK